MEQIADAHATVSESVRAFYERMPYPPPVADLDAQRALCGDPMRRRALFHQAWPAQTQREDYEILVAGCGTSQAVRYAFREPGARITAIDISEASLLHTRHLANRYRLDNLELHHLPVERVQHLRRSFDLIVCTGVLHHVPDPDLGLQSLREVLDRQGAMRLMVYAPYGRAGIYMMQTYCRMLGIGTSDKDLRDLGAGLDALPSDHPIATVLRKAKDFRRPDAMADALLHPSDRAFTVGEVYDWLERCGMSFGRWTEQAPYLPACGRVATGAHAARLAPLAPRLQHGAMELLRGTMVSHSFIAYRDDRIGPVSPVTFHGGAWRDYIPIPVASTVCVRNGLPKGCASVLINGAHRYPDLVLPLDPIEDRLHSLMDGTKTLADVVSSAELDINGQRLATGFFERLWQYDHVIVDASRAGREGSLGKEVGR